MLFNSYSFILIFLPLTAALYFLMHRYLSSRWAFCFLTAASLAFMSFWNVRFALVLLSSVLFNFLCGSALSVIAEKNPDRKKPLFIFAIVINVLFLGFFKYTNFFLDNINTLFSAQIQPLHILLPIGVSFYTFMQIAWLTDIYRQGGYRYGFVHYCLYVTFFPYVMSGPIAYHKEIIPQFQDEKKRRVNPVNLCRGLFILSIGLVKKVIIADTLAGIANAGFTSADALTLAEAWLTSLSYTMQLYFDFSGYTDMAMGAALIFNIDIPANFHSPYKALNIQDFWRRWHITLSRFLRDYIYIPLGGNRKGGNRTLLHLMLTFLLAGLWHGAAWTFVFWGFLHGAALCVHRLWQKTGIRMNKVLAWLLTFNFINIAWVFFRARSFDEALSILKGMAGANGIVVAPHLAQEPFWQSLTVIGVRFGNWCAHLPDVESHVYFISVLLIPFVLLAKNSNELLEKYAPSWRYAFAVSLLLVAALLYLNATSTFIYFMF